MKKKVYLTTRNLVVLLLSATSFTALTGQTKETVILYNSVPVEVEIDKEGDIKRFKEEKPKHLEGYTIDTKQRMDNEIKDVTPTKAQGTDILDDGPIAILFDAGSTDSPTMRGLDLLNGVAARLRSKSALKGILRAPQTSDDDLIQRYNGQLASCKNYLISQGVNESQITTTLSPSATNADEIIITFE